MIDAQGQRYIVDLGEIGKIYLSAIKNLFFPTEQYSGNLAIQEKITNIYRESTAQVILLMDNNAEEFPLKLLHSLDYGRLGINPNLIDSKLIEKFVACFREFAIDLFFTINNKINRELEPVEYFLEGIALDYVVIVQLKLNIIAGTEYASI